MFSQSDPGVILNIKINLFVKTTILKDIVKNIHTILTGCDELKAFVKSSINQNAIDFIDNYNNVQLPTTSTGITIVRNMDEMAHVNKGVMGVRMGHTHNVILRNLIVKNITNSGENADNLIKDISKNYGLAVNVPDSTLISNKSIIGAFSIGFIASSCNCITAHKMCISNVESYNSAGIGITINNECNNINVIRSTVKNIMSHSRFTDSYAYLIDEKSKKIQFCSLYN